MAPNYSPVSIRSPHSAHMRARATLAVSVACVAALAIAPSAAAGQFDYTDTSTTGSWTVPTGASVVQVVLQGAGGGNGLSIGSGTGGSGGLGANVASSINVTDGEVLQIGLGARGGDATGVAGANAGGASGFTGSGGLGGFGIGSDDGGGGGGASVVRIGGVDVLVSAGGGGGGEADGAGGLEPTPTGGSGGSGTSGFIVRTGSEFIAGNPGGSGSNASAATGGGGGAGLAGGSAGDGGLLGSTQGTRNNGGNGGANRCSGGGGGGGYYGGGGGGGGADFASSGCGGGGAGSSYMAAARTGTNRIYSESATGRDARAQVNYIDFTTSSLNSGRVGEAYTQNVVATFGAATAPDVWSVSPALPAGLTLNTATGAITGTPTSAASGTYTITASYNSGGPGLIARSAISLTLIIASAPSDNTANTVQSGTGDSAIAPRLTGVGGPWTVTVGVPAIIVPASNSGTFARYAISPALPDGLSLNPTSGVISGTASSPSASTLYTLTATNTAGSSSLAFRLGVNEAMLANPGAAKGAQTLTKVAFAGSATRLSGRAKQRLMSRVRDVDTPVRISVEVTDPSSSTQMRVAYARGIAIRQFLRSQGATVESPIVLAPQVGASSAPRAWVRTSA